MSKIDSAAIEPAPAASNRANDIEMPIERCRGNHPPSLAMVRSTEAWNVAHRAKEAPKVLLRRI
jgi:hypothetical protein